MTIIAEQSAASWQIASNVTEHDEDKIFHKHIARFGPSGILRLGMSLRNLRLPKSRERTLEKIREKSRRIPIGLM